VAPRIKRILVLLIVLGLVAAIALLGMSRIGYWLIVADPLERAAAIVVLSGDMPFRAIEAAALYGEKWAPEIWLTRESRPMLDAELKRLRIHHLHEDEYSRQVLTRSGVPDAAIRLLDGEIINTVDEIDLIRAELARRHANVVIIVTSKVHTRRVRATWHALVEQPLRAIVRPAPDRYDGARWWRNTYDALSVSREVFGLMNVWAGFPVKPDRQRL